MSIQITMQGEVKSDGTLELSEKVPMPAGQVLVTVQPVVQPPPNDPFWQTMERIWADQRARGHVARTREEIDADVATMRQEWEVHQLAIERLQDECRQAREQAQSEKEPSA